MQKLVVLKKSGHHGHDVMQAKIQSGVVRTVSGFDLKQFCYVVQLGGIGQFKIPPADVFGCIQGLTKDGFEDKEEHDRQGCTGWDGDHPGSKNLPHNFQVNG